jgi:hypothetical protein
MEREDRGHKNLTLGDVGYSGAVENAGTTTGNINGQNTIIGEPVQLFE